MTDFMSNCWLLPSTRSAAHSSQTRQKRERERCGIQTSSGQNYIYIYFTPIINAYFSNLHHCFFVLAHQYMQTCHHHDLCKKRQRHQKPFQVLSPVSIWHSRVLQGSEWPFVYKEKDFGWNECWGLAEATF